MPQPVRSADRSLVMLPIPDDHRRNRDHRKALRPWLPWPFILIKSRCPEVRECRGF